MTEITFALPPLPPIEQLLHRENRMDKIRRAAPVAAFVGAALATAVAGIVIKENALAATAAVVATAAAAVTGAKAIKKEGIGRRKAEKNAAITAVVAVVVSIAIIAFPDPLSLIRSMMPNL